MVVPPKRIDLLLRVFQRRKPVHVQILFPEAPVERFDGGVVGRFAAPTEVQDDAVGIRPEVHRGADELGSVVAINTLRQSALKA